MARPPFISLVAEEPYRVLFPLGIVTGLIGVGLWPLWVAGLLDVYPGLAHARLMTEGFFTAFILGFLGTAGPRMLEARHLSLRLWILIGACWAAAQIFSLLNWHNWAEGAFALTIALFLVAMFKRIRTRSGMPPAGFIVVLVSLILAIPAALTQMPLLQRNFSSVPVGVWLSGRAFLVEGYILLPILGVAPFFFGRFGGLAPSHFPGDTARADPKWKRQTTITAITAALILLALLAKVNGWPRSGATLQAVVTAGFILTQVPFRYHKSATIARIAQCALIALFAAPLIEAFLPGERIAWRHLLLIGGFQGTVLVVGSWVIFAHAGQRERLGGKSHLLRIIGVCLLIAIISRVAAEFLSSIYNSHLVYAALFWIAATLAWLLILLPRLREEG